MSDLDAEAWRFARTAISARERDHTTQENAFRHWIAKRLKYDEKQAMQELAQDNAMLMRQLHDAELTRLVQAEKFTEEWTCKSWKIFFAVLTPASADGSEPLLWNHRFTDEKTGLKSPTIEEIIKEQCPAIAEPLAVTDPKRYAKEIAEKFDERKFEYEFDRATVNAYAKGDLLRWFTVQWMLRAVRFPAEKALKNKRE